MTLEVIAAGLGRNATLSMKFALEALGFGPCHHMTEVLADSRRQIPLWLEVARGTPDWEAVFAGFKSTSDYPSASYWQELAMFYPAAKVVLTTREPDSWFDSVSQTIFSPAMKSAHAGGPVEDLMQATIFDHIDGDISDRAFLTGWYAARNQQVIDAMAPGRLLVFHPREGWEPLCTFLGVPVPDVPFPGVNRRAELGTLTNQAARVTMSPEAAERFARQYIEVMRIEALKPGG